MKSTIMKLLKYSTNDPQKTNRNRCCNCSVFRSENFSNCDNWIMKHTKGKWELEPTEALRENGQPLYYNISSNGNMLAATFKNQYIDDMCDEMQLANAKIIACSPELLIALMEMVDIFDREHSELEQGNAIHNAKQLIKKSTL